MGIRARIRRIYSWVVALLIFLGSCDLSPDGPEPINQRIAAPVGAEQAFDFAENEWEARLGPPGVNPHDTVPHVRWFKGIVRTLDGKCCYIEYDNIRDASEGPVRVYSMYWPWNFTIDVTPLTPDGRPSGSGLAREILHWVLLSSGRTDDDSYSQDIWKQESEVRALMKANGL